MFVVSLLCGKIPRQLTKTRPYFDCENGVRVNWTVDAGAFLSGLLSLAPPAADVDASRPDGGGCGERIVALSGRTGL